MNNSKGWSSRIRERTSSSSMSFPGALTGMWPWRLIKGSLRQTCDRCAAGVQSKKKAIGRVLRLLIFPKFPQTPACFAEIKDIEPQTAG